MLFNFFPKGSSTPAQKIRDRNVSETPKTMSLSRKEKRGKLLQVLNRSRDIRKNNFHHYERKFIPCVVLHDMSKRSITCKCLKLFAEFSTFINQVHYFLPEKICQCKRKFFADADSNESTSFVINFFYQFPACHTVRIYIKQEGGREREREEEGEDRDLDKG